MHLLCINQYTPPDRAPTARLLGDLAEYLRARGHTVTLVSQAQSYRDHPSRSGSRLKRELMALLSIFWRALRTGPRPDVVLSLSSPPGVLPLAAVVAMLRGAKLAHWAMDLYPELAVALEEIKLGRVASAVRAAMAWSYRRSVLNVVLDEDMRAHLKTNYAVESTVIRVWPSQALHPPDAFDAEERWTWLYSGNLGRAHDWKTLLDAQRLLEDRGHAIHLVFQGRGSVRAAAQAYAAELHLSNLLWQDYVSEEDLIASLLRARVLVASQRQEASGLLWPSKLALLLSLPRPLLFVGPPEGAIAVDVRSAAPANGVFANGDAAAVADWVQARFTQTAAPAWDAEAAKSLRAAIARGHDEGCASWERWLTADR